MGVKYGLLNYSLSRNIGDEIQSIAALQFLPRVDRYVDRDFLDSESFLDQTKVILNGWFTIKPENWPPNPNILPLLVSFHITHKHQSLKYFSSEEYLKYLRSKSPIGCRDLWTFNFLRKHGIETYLSGCLTLTLQREHFGEVPQSDEIIFTDSDINIPEKYKQSFFEYLIPEEHKANAHLVNHWDYCPSADTNLKMSAAHDLIKRYLGARLVVTSRLHCFLPCLALGVPVYLIDYGYNLPESRNRFEGLIDNLPVINVDNEDRFFFKKRGIKKVAYTIRNCIDWEKKENGANEELISKAKRMKMIVNSFLTE